MALNFPTSEWFEDSGNAANVFVENVRDGIATTACNIWQEFPSFVTKGTNPISSFSRGFMNQACSGIQPPVPPPTVPFTGGQCVGVNYVVSVKVIIRNTVVGCPIVTDTTVDFVIEGPVQGIQTVVTNEDAGFSQCSPGDFQPIRRVTYRLVGATSVDVASNAPVSKGTVPSPLSSAEIVNVVRQDGQPDTCGDPPPQYDDEEPTLDDLTTTIVITNLDGVDNEYNITYNQLSNQYNFPFGFKFNGINVTVDLGGITIHGSPSFSSPNNGNDLPPPGSDGGKNGFGEPYVQEFPDSEYPVLPPITVPETVEETIEYLLCEEGIVESISEVVKSIPGLSPIYGIILEVLANIVSELCEEGAVGDVGFPEYYPVLPGTERPAVVLYFKEIVDGVKSKPTYTTTITHPSAAFLADFNTVAIPDKTIGSFVRSGRLSDGSRLIASGDTAFSAESTFIIYASYLDSSFVPPDFFLKAVTTEYSTLQTKTVKCTQLEYYPNGRAAGVSPSMLRFVDVT